MQNMELQTPINSLSGYFIKDGCHDILYAVVFQGVKYNITVTAGLQDTTGLQDA